MFLHGKGKRLGGRGESLGPGVDASGRLTEVTASDVDILPLSPQLSLQRRERR